MSKIVTVLLLGLTVLSAMMGMLGEIKILAWLTAVFGAATFLSLGLWPKKVEE